MQALTLVDQLPECKNVNDTQLSNQPTKHKAEPWVV